MAKAGGGSRSMNIPGYKYSGPNTLTKEEQARALDRLKTINGRKRKLMLRDIGWGPDQRRLQIIGIPKTAEQLVKYGEVRTVPLMSIERAQTSVPTSGVRSYISNPPGPLPEVVFTDGQYVVFSGHTRLAAQILAGRTEAQVTVYRLGKDYRLLRPRG